METQIEKVLKMDRYTDEGKVNMQRFASIIEKIGDLLTGEELHRLYDIVDGGHVSEFLELLSEKIKISHPETFEKYWGGYREEWKDEE